MTSTFLPVVNALEAAVSYSASLIGGSRRSSTDAEITLEEVLCHDTRRDCWVVIYDRVYDITNFLDEHPGGGDLLLENAGRDATVAFRSAGHSRHAMQLLERYFIGELPLQERVFRKVGGFKLSNMPE
ncbi:cytochrome b5-like [Coccinella septempunctata]|uniref:cytochrome b5-like n=1 Tax=Coccinella septempunctata TaxID=41139 RepID=UPI001D08B775|nr:cytochrome b5-like [Coccinella septempunctata]